MDQHTLDLEQLPRTLQEVAEIIGLPAALVLARRWGGRRLWVGQQPTDALTMYLGSDAARRLCAHYQGEALDVPACSNALMGQRDAAIHAKRAQGVRISDLSIEFGISERQIGYILRGRGRSRRGGR